MLCTSRAFSRSHALGSAAPWAALALAVLLGGCSDSAADGRQLESAPGAGGAVAALPSLTLRLDERELSGADVGLVNLLRSRSGPFLTSVTARVQPDDLFPPADYPDAAWAGREAGLEFSLQLHLPAWELGQFEFVQSLAAMREGGDRAAYAALFISDGTVDSDAWPQPDRSLAAGGTLELHSLRTESDESGRTWAVQLAGVLTGELAAREPSGELRAGHPIRIEFDASRD